MPAPPPCGPGEAATSALDDLLVLACRALDAPAALVACDHGTTLDLVVCTGIGASDATSALARWCKPPAEHPQARADLPPDPGPAEAAQLASGQPVRSAAAAPIVAADGGVRGHLCVLDHRLRPFDGTERDTLQRLARLAAPVLDAWGAAAWPHEREQSLQRLAQVARQTHNAVILADRHGLVTWVNEAFTQLSGYAAHDVIGRQPVELLRFEGTDARACEALRAAIALRRAARVHIELRGRHGRRYWADTALQPQTADDGTWLGYVAIQTDITELVQQRAHEQALIEALPVGLIEHDSDGRVARVNAAAASLLETDARELVGQLLRWERWHAVDVQGRPLHDDERPARQVLASGQPVAQRLFGVTLPSGRRRWLRSSAAPLRSADGPIRAVVTTLTDVTDELHRLQWLDLATRAADLGPWSWDAGSNRLEIEPRWAQRIGFDGSVRGWWRRVHPDDVAAMRAALDAHFADPQRAYVAEYRIRDASGHWCWVQSCGAVTERDAQGRPLRLTGVLLAIDERKRAEEALRRSATSDPLTGLPNRTLMRQRLAHALSAARSHGHHGALLLLDLDHFKRVNDTHGHAVGDALLCAVGNRLDAQLRAEDVLARMGGDELMVLLPHLGTTAADAAAQAQQVAETLQQALRRPFKLQHGEFTIGASIGSTLFPKSPTESADDLIREADTAMYAAKQRARGSVRAYEPVMQAREARRLWLERDLRRALTRGEFALHLQGQWRPSGELAGAEALLRWTPGASKATGPAEFVPVAEDSGLIVPIGRWVIEQACLAARALARDGRALPIAVNVSARQFRDHGFAADLRAIVGAAGVPPHALTLELTEGMLADDASMALMSTLAGDGFRISIDDFGTGYSSLMYLKKLPLHELKIDRAFVRDIARDRDDETIVRAILGIARHFRIDAVAEGVETPAQAQFLVAHGCSRLQGFLYGRPMPVGEFIAATCTDAGSAHTASSAR